MLIKNKIKVVILLISYIYLVLGAKIEDLHNVEAQSQNKSFILKTMAVSVVKNALLGGCFWFFPKAYSSFEDKKYPIIFGVATVLGSCFFKKKLRRDPSRKWISLCRDGLYDGSLYFLMFYRSDDKEKLFISMCDVSFSVLCECEKDLESTSVLQCQGRVLDKSVVESESFSKNDEGKKKKEEKIELQKQKLANFENELKKLKEENNELLTQKEEEIELLKQNKASLEKELKQLKEENRLLSFYKKSMETTEKALQDAKGYCQKLFNEIERQNERQFSPYKQYYEYLNNYPFKQKNSDKLFGGYINFAKWLNYLSKQLEEETETNIFCYQNFFYTSDQYGCCFDFKDLGNEAIINYLNENSDECIVQAIQIIKNFEIEFSMFLQGCGYSSFEIVQAIYNFCKLSYFGSSYDFQQIIEKDDVEKLKQLVKTMGTHVVYVKPKSDKKQGEKLGEYLLSLCSRILNHEEKHCADEIMSNDFFKFWYSFFKKKSNSFILQEAKMLQKKEAKEKRYVTRKEQFVKIEQQFLNSRGPIDKNHNNVYTNEGTDDSKSHGVENQFSFQVPLLPNDSFYDFIETKITQYNIEDAGKEDFTNILQNFFLDWPQTEETSIDDYIQQYYTGTSDKEVEEEKAIGNHDDNVKKVIVNYYFYLKKMNSKIEIQNAGESPY